MSFRHKWNHFPNLEERFPQESLYDSLEHASAKERKPNHIVFTADISAFSVRNLSEGPKVGVFSCIAVW
jgi:hypothetical protein